MCINSFCENWLKIFIKVPVDKYLLPNLQFKILTNSFERQFRFYLVLPIVLNEEGIAPRKKIRLIQPNQLVK